MALDNTGATPNQVLKALKTAIKIKRPVFLWGPPGIGKSDIVKQVAVNELGGALIDMRLAQCDATDLRGVPYFNSVDKNMSWAPPVELPTKEFAAQYPVVVLFLDELTSAAPNIQGAAYQLVLDRKVGTYTLPDNVVIVAAGNRQQDNGVTYNMKAPLANRFIHLEMRCDFDSWQDWAVKAGLHQDIVGYLSFAKQDLYGFNPKSDSKAFNTPRTWTFVDSILKDDACDSSTRDLLIGGTVGEGIAIKFASHRKHAGRLPNPTDILIGKVKTLTKDASGKADIEISGMYSLVISMCYELRDFAQCDTFNADKFDEFANNYIGFMLNNFEPELCIMGTRIAFKTYNLPMRIQKMANYKDFTAKYGKYIKQSM